MNKIKRIIITGDVRRSVTSQLGNITRFYWMLAAQIEYLTTIKPELWVTEDRVSIEEWIKYYDPEYADVKPWIAEQIDLTDCLLLTWEMPYNWLSWLEKHNIPFVDFLTYPSCLFGGGLGINSCYGVRIGKELEKRHFDKYPPSASGIVRLIDNQLTDYDFQKKANYYRAKYAEVDRIPVEKNTGLIIGQTPIDRSLINAEGEMLTLKDYKELLLKIKSEHSGLIFRPHPNAWDRSIDNFMINEIGCIGWDFISSYKPEGQREWGIYDIMSEPKISGVYAISSSCVFEAQFFDKKTVRFDEVYYNHVFNNYVPVMWTDIQKEEWLENVLEGI
jgi:hypothetical protein